jgi:broad specificity phosphatase PhoE
MLPPLPANPLLQIEQGGTEILLVRHGHAVPQGNALVSGTYDDQPLSKLGRHQAQALASHLKSIEIRAIYSSPIRRAYETATYLAQAKRLPVQPDAEFREVDLSAMRPVLTETMSATDRAAVLQGYLNQAEAIALQVGSWSAIPGIESSQAVRQRMREALGKVAARHGGQRIVVVSHAGAINTAIAECLGLERDFFFPAANTSLSIVRCFEDRRLVVALNDVSHLKARWR